MTDPTLVNYLKQNLASGFTPEQIQLTLRQAGWNDQDIREAFVEALPQRTTGGLLAKHKRKLLVILIALVALPFLVFAGTWAYQKLAAKPAAPSNNQPQPPGQTATATGADQATQQMAAHDRDLKRLGDIQNIQIALGAYFQKHQSYPKTLEDLAADGELATVPDDPKLPGNYVYSPFGEPPQQYSLAFLLETDVGSLQSGLLVVTSEKPLPSDLIQSQDQLVKGITKTNENQQLNITDLSQTAFYPGEEIILEITPPKDIAMQTARLIMQNLSLIKQTPPFRFQFTAPAAPGEYQIKVYGFDVSGSGYSASTAIHVSVQP